VSDSKKDLTRIEDLGEYLHQLDDEVEDYLPELPEESAPSAFMEETQITENPFLSEESETDFESDVPAFESENNFSEEENYNFDSDSNSDFDSGSDFNSDSETDFDSNSSFSTDSTFDSDSDFSNNDFTTDENESPSFENQEESSYTNEFESSDDPFSSPVEENTQNDTEELPQLDQNLPPPPIESDSPAIDDFAPIEDTPVVEKTPLPQPEVSSSYSAPENFSDLKKFAESSSFTGMASEGNPSFSVLIKEVKFLEDAQDILALIKELGLAMDSDEILMKRLTRGEFLVPRISEYAATFLAHKLRRFDIDIMVGLSDEIQPPKHTEEPEVGLVSKHNLYQNQSHHFQFDEVNLDISQIILSATPTLDGYQVLKYIGVASEHKILESYLVEDENSLEVSSHYQELAQKLKAHALKSNANAVVGLNYQLTPLPSTYGTSNTRYRLTCTGNLVWINKI